MRPQRATPVCRIGFEPRKDFSDTEILHLGTYDFMAHIGKRVINPGGLTGRAQVLEHLQIERGSRVLEIGSGTGHAACDIAARYGCHVTATDLSPSMIEEARETVTARGMAGRVVCQVADVTRLPFETDQFDYVVVQAVLMFVNRNWSAALGEIQRVLKPAGRYAGLEFTWRAEPPDEVRHWTDTVCGCPSMVFLSTPGWKRELERAGFDHIYANEEPFNMLSMTGFLRDEGVRNSMKIFGRLLRRRANLVRMTQIWRHFSTNLRFFSYTVLAGSKPR